MLCKYCSRNDSSVSSGCKVPSFSLKKTHKPHTFLKQKIKRETEGLSHLEIIYISDKSGIKVILYSSECIIIELNMTVQQPNFCERKNHNDFDTKKLCKNFEHTVCASMYIFIVAYKISLVVSINKEFVQKILCIHFSNFKKKNKSLDTFVFKDLVPSKDVENT